MGTPTLFRVVDCLNIQFIVIELIIQAIKMSIIILI